jgi:glycosyltransferase involved in cell wall biosynthesis
MTLRVAIVALYPAPGRKSPGGVRAVVQNLVQGLRHYDDLQIHVIHCHADIDASTRLQDGNVWVDYIAMPRQRLVPNSLAAIWKVEQRLRQVQPDIVHTHAAHDTLAALRAGLPTVFTIHGVVELEAEVYTHRLFDRARYWLETRLQSRALQQAKDIVAISPHVLDQYQGRSPARFHQIDNPVDDEFFSVSDRAEPGRMFYAGTIDERKNVLDLVRALGTIRASVPYARLVIAGRTTNPGYFQHVKDLTASQDLLDSVEFLGLVDKPRLLEELARCAVAVLASRQETAPMAVIEAMAAGKPVVATRVGGVPGIVEHGRSGFLVEAGNVEGFAGHCIQLLSDPGLRSAMGQHARQLAQRFRLETVAGAYRDLYYTLVGRVAP